MVFTTGYQANLGAISTLAGPGDYLLVDADSHASIYDACRLGHAHGDPLQAQRPGRSRQAPGAPAKEPGNKIVVVEGIYSMLGDHAPLKEFVAVKKKHGAYLLVDEAHSMGVMGKTGRGCLEHDGVDADVDFITGTFSKSMGAIGGFLISDHPDFDILRVACRPYMFTGFAAALDHRLGARFAGAPPRRRSGDDEAASGRTWTRSMTGWQAKGFRLGKQRGPVVAVHINGPELAAMAWHGLLSNGVYVNLALPPATPSGTALLRCSVCAAHTTEQLEQVIEALTEVGRQLGIIPAEDGAGQVQGRCRIAGTSRA